MSVLGRGVVYDPKAPLAPTTRHSHCYLCEKPIGDDEERVDGVKTSAHRACIETKLDGLNPNWRELSHNRGNGRVKK